MINTLDEYKHINTSNVKMNIQKLKIRILKSQDISENYLRWLNDPEITKFSNNQYKNHSLEKQKKYLNDCLIDSNIDLYGIFYVNKHVGNISINDINNIHKRSEITYVLGDRSYWSKGIMSASIKILVLKAKKDYKLNKLFASCANENFASRRVLEKNGFILEGTRKKHLFFQKKWYDQLDYGLIL